MTPLSTSRSELESGTVQHGCSFGESDVATEQVRDVAQRRPWRVGFEPAREVLQQQVRRAGRLDLVIDRAGLDARLQAIGQPLQLAVEDQPAAELEDVGASSDQPSGFEHAGLLASGVDHDLDVGSRARFEGSGAEQAEAPVGTGDQRCVGAEQGAVEIHIQAAHRGATVAADALRRRPRTPAWREMLPR